jgi:small-conductance mechanosensitive channel
MPFHPPTDGVLAERLAGLALWQWLGVAGALLLSVVVAWTLQGITLWLVARLGRFAFTHKWSEGFIAAARGPLRWLLWSIGFAAGVRTLRLTATMLELCDLLARSVAIFTFAWFLLRVIHLGASAVEASSLPPMSDFRMRALRTQIAVMRRVVEVLVWLFASATFLMQFGIVRSVGVSLLASAGIAGLVLGLAAQRTIGMLLAGLQLSITQPIRIGDQVVLEKEVGHVEEIHLTYVVLRLWDLRRLVVPITYFLEKPFESWSRGATDLIGWIHLEVDFSADVEAFRAELTRILTEEGKGLWDGKTANLVVFDAVERAMTLRALVSSEDPAKNGDLKALVRERLITFLKRHPQWMPTARQQAVVARESL